MRSTGMTFNITRSIFKKKELYLLLLAKSISMKKYYQCLLNDEIITVITCGNLKLIANSFEGFSSFSPITCSTSLCIVLFYVFAVSPLCDAEPMIFVIFV
jgi:hypothetical protein